MNLTRNHFQHNSSWNALYTFSGKEKDVETGYGYLSARYYDSGLSVWLSVDPLSDKYPTLSPYTYCANNPIMMVDPDGKQISVMFNNVKYTITGGKVYANGNEFTGEFPKIVQIVNTSINKIKETAIGREIMIQLEKDINEGGPDIIFQESTDNENHYLGYKEGEKLVNATISISEKSSLKPFIRKTDGEYNKNFIEWRTDITGSIMHELAHAYVDCIGTSMSGNYNDLDLHDWQACFYENTYYLQSQKERFLRTHYSQKPMYDHNGKFQYWKATGPLLLYGMTPKDPRTF